LDATLATTSIPPAAPPESGHLEIALLMLVPRFLGAIKSRRIIFILFHLPEALSHAVALHLLTETHKERELGEVLNGNISNPNNQSLQGVVQTFDESSPCLCQGLSHIHQPKDGVRGEVIGWSPIKWPCFCMPSTCRGATVYTHMSQPGHSHNSTQ